MADCRVHVCSTPGPYYSCSFFTFRLIVVVPDLSLPPGIFPHPALDGKGSPQRFADDGRDRAVAVAAVAVVFVVAMEDTGHGDIDGVKALESGV